MTYCVRKMQWDDIEQVKAIDLACFPTMMPPTNYKTEFINPLAHYLVAYDNAKEGETDDKKADVILGFVGLWYMASEVHIINLAVHPNHRHQGVGELLLIHAIELSVELKAILVTLEVRISNHIARALYFKYGFTEKGVRRAYYLDNREDAYVMTLDGMASPQYQERFARLKQMYVTRWGIPAGNMP